MIQKLKAVDYHHFYSESCELMLGYVVHFKLNNQVLMEIWILNFVCVKKRRK